MNRAQTNYFTGMLFMLSFVIWVLGGGIAFSQTQTGDASDTPPTAREEPTASQDQGEVIERAIRQGASGLGETEGCVCMRPLGQCVFSAQGGCVPHPGNPCNGGCIMRKPSTGGR